MSTPAHTLPSSLEKFLDERLPLFREQPPDADWVDGVAEIHKITPEVVWDAVRARMPGAPVAPLPLVWTRPLDVPVAPPVVERTRPLDTQHPFDRVLSALRARSCRIVPKHDARGREAKRATCPAHDDHNPSLVITADGHNVLLHCFGGCPVARIVAALDLKLADLFSGPPQAQVRRRHTEVVKPAPAAKLSPEERLARKRMLTAARTRRWRERRQTIQPVTHPNIRSVTCDAGDAGDAPNVLQGTSLSVFRDPLSGESVHPCGDGEIPADVDTYPDLSGGRSPGDDWRRR